MAEPRHFEAFGGCKGGGWKLKDYHNRPKPFWLRTGIGPGTVAMLMLLAFVLWQRWQPTRPVTPLPPPVGAQHGAPLPAREPQWLLERAEELELNEEQRGKIAALQREYERRTATLRRKLDEVSQAFQRFMEEAQRKGGLKTVGEIQEQGKELSRLSRLVAQERKDAWEQALAVLTEKQRQQITKSDE